MRRIPGTKPLALVVLLVIGVAGCGPLPWPMPEAQEQALREQAELYALAARGFEELVGEWPASADDFDPYLPARAPSEAGELEAGELWIEAMDAGDDAFTMTFVFGPSPRGDEPGSVRGELEVWREGTADRPAATLEWTYHGLALDRSGEWTLRECGPEPHLEPC